MGATCAGEGIGWRRAEGCRDRWSVCRRFVRSWGFSEIVAGYGQSGRYGMVFDVSAGIRFHSFLLMLSIRCFAAIAHCTSANSPRSFVPCKGRI